MNKLVLSNTKFYPKGTMKISLPYMVSSSAETLNNYFQYFYYY